MSRNDTENKKLPDKVLKRLFQKHKTSAFKRPFYLLLVMKLLSAEWRNGAEQILRKCWSTAWGGGTIVNALLFNGEHAVPESGMDMRRQTWNHCYYRSCRANELFACILYHSELWDVRGVDPGWIGGYLRKGRCALLAEDVWSRVGSLPETPPVSVHHPAKLITVPDRRFKPFLLRGTARACALQAACGSLL